MAHRKSFQPPWGPAGTITKYFSRPLGELVLAKEFTPSASAISRPTAVARNSVLLAKYAGGYLYGPEWGIKTGYHEHARVCLSFKRHCAQRGDGEEPGTAAGSGSASSAGPALASGASDLSDDKLLAAPARETRLHVNRPDDERILVASAAGQQADSSLGFTCRHGASWPLVTHAANVRCVLGASAREGEEPLPEVPEDPALAYASLRMHRSTLVQTFPSLMATFGNQMSYAGDAQGDSIANLLHPRKGADLDALLEGCSKAGGKTVTNVERLGGGISSIEAAGIGNMYQLVSAYSLALTIWHCDVHSSQLDCSAEAERQRVTDHIGPAIVAHQRVETLEFARYKNLIESVRGGGHLLHSASKIFSAWWKGAPRGFGYPKRREVSPAMYRFIRSVSDVLDSCNMATYALAEAALTRTERDPLEQRLIQPMYNEVLQVLSFSSDFDACERPLLYDFTAGTEEAFGLGPEPKLTLDAQAACDWVSPEEGTALPLSTHFDYAHAVRLLYGAQQNCIVRSVRAMQKAIRVGTKTRSDMVALSKKTWMPEWLDVITIAAIQTIEHPSVLTASATGRLMAHCLQRIPSKIIERNKEELIARMCETASHRGTPDYILKLALQLPYQRMWDHVLQWVVAHAGDTPEGECAAQELKEHFDTREEPHRWLEPLADGGGPTSGAGYGATGGAEPRDPLKLEGVRTLGPKDNARGAAASVDDSSSSKGGMSGGGIAGSPPDALSQLLAMPICAVEAQPWIAAIEMQAVLMLRGFEQPEFVPIPRVVRMLFHSGRTWPRVAPRLPASYNPIGLPDLGTEGMKRIGARPAFHRGAVEGQLVHDNETVGRALEVLDGLYMAQRRL